MRIVNLLYRVARIANDVSYLAKPEKIPKRIVNKLIGRNVVSKLYLGASRGKGGRRRGR